MFKKLITALQAVFLALLCFTNPAFAQTPINGKIEVVSNGNNALVVRYLLQADLKKLGSSTLIVSYNHNVLSLAETPQPASNPGLTDGEFYYNPAFQTNSDYWRKDISRVIKGEGTPTETHHSYANIDYLFPTPSTAQSLDSWTEIVVLKFNIISSGTADYNFILTGPEVTFLDDAGVNFSFGTFSVPTINVTYISPVLKLNSVGNGNATYPYTVTIKSTSASTYNAGTAGFYVYYNSEDATAASGTDKLNVEPFFWGNATIIDEAIPTVSKNTIQYDRRLKYIASDGTQSDDNWAALSSPAINALDVVFTPTTNGIDNGIKTYLEALNETSFRNWDETINHMTLVENATRLINYNSSGPGPLPVSLLEFTATPEKNQVILNWSTASEKNNHKFEVERSAAGKYFETIAIVKGFGNSSELQNYSTIDIKPLSGISYYRLKQFDYDGTTAYSLIVKVNLIAKSESLTIQSVYPNPTNNITSINCNLTSDENILISISDITGKVIAIQQFSGKTGSNTFTLKDLQELSSGVYLIGLKSSTGQAFTKLVKE